MPVPEPTAENVNLQPPDDAETQVMADGIASAVGGRDGLLPVQRALLEALFPAMTGFAVTLDEQAVHERRRVRGGHGPARTLLSCPHGAGHAPRRAAPASPDRRRGRHRGRLRGGARRRGRHGRRRPGVRGRLAGPGGLRLPAQRVRGHVARTRGGVGRHAALDARSCTTRGRPTRTTRSWRRAGPRSRRCPPSPSAARCGRCTRPVASPSRALRARPRPSWPSTTGCTCWRTTAPPSSRRSRSSGSSPGPTTTCTPSRSWPW